MAVVVDDPEGKKQMTDALKDVFDEADGKRGETFKITFDVLVVFKLMREALQ